MARDLNDCVMPKPEAEADVLYSIYSLTLKQGRGCATTCLGTVLPALVATENPQEKRNTVVIGEEDSMVNKIVVTE